MVTGIATRTAATSSFPAQPWANDGRVTEEQHPQGPAPDQGVERCQQQRPQQHDTNESQPQQEAGARAQRTTRPIPTTTSTMRRRPPGAARPDGGGWSDDERCGRVGEKVQGGRHQVHLCA